MKMTEVQKETALDYIFEVSNVRLCVAMKTSSESVMV
jgi:hypothetical protein